MLDTIFELDWFFSQWIVFVRILEEFENTKNALCIIPMKISQNFDDYQPKTIFMYYFAHGCKVKTIFANFFQYCRLLDWWEPKKVEIYLQALMSHFCWSSLIIQESSKWHLDQKTFFFEKTFTNIKFRIRENMWWVRT